MKIVITRKAGKSGNSPGQNGAIVADNVQYLVANTLTVDSANKVDLTFNLSGTIIEICRLAPLLF